MNISPALTGRKLHTYRLYHTLSFSFYALITPKPSTIINTKVCVVGFVYGIVIIICMGLLLSLLLLSLLLLLYQNKLNLQIW